MKLYLIIWAVWFMAINSSMAQNWFPTSAPSESWTSLSSSTDGKRLAAAAGTYSPIYVSTNSGATWQKTSAPLAYWSCIASSGDGSSLVAAQTYLNGLVYRSSDFGATWTATSAPGDEWQCIASSANGRVLVGGTYGSSVFVSTNSGTSWNLCLPPGYWGSVTSSAQGDILMAIGGLTHQSVCISTNSGATWQTITNAPKLNWYQAACSADAGLLALEANGGPLVTSTNLGATWITNNVPDKSWGHFACSADGKKFVIATQEGKIYSSSDGAVTWTLNKFPNNLNWDAVTCNSDGSKMWAVAGNQIYASPPIPQPPLSLVAWNANLYGQSSVPEVVSNVVFTTASQYDSLAIRNDGSVFEWGVGSQGQTNVPAGLTNITSAAAGEKLSLALRNDGTVAYWGASSYTNNISSLTNISALAASQLDFYSALQSNGTVITWGNNTYAQTNVPAGLSNVVAITEGDSHCLALKSDGTVVGWGGNRTGTFGQAKIPADLSNVVAIAAGDAYSLALKDDGTVTGFPTNDYNVVLGIPSGLSNVVAIAAQSQHALALTSDGSVWEWGNVGTGFLNYQVGLTNVIGIACGYYHSLAIVGDGTPAIIRQPWNQTVYGGYPVSFSAGCVGSPPISYQWQLNGTNITDATNYVFRITNAQPANAGIYTLTITNSQGTATSSAGVLSVLTNPPDIKLQPSSRTVIASSNVTFNVATGIGPIPINFQWRFNTVPIPGATNASLTLTNVQVTNNGNYDVIVSNPFGTAYSTNATLTVLDLTAALNAADLVWTTGGSAAWFVETNTTHDGFAAAQTGPVTSGQTSTLQTTVTGPGTLTFWWNLSSFGNMAFSANGVSQGSLGFPNSSWQKKTVYLAAGNETLLWKYTGGSISYGSNAGWLDQVNFVPGGTGAFITSPLLSRSVPQGTSVGFSVSALGTPPISYQWQFNGKSLADATNTALTLINVQTTNSGIYSVIVSNNYGPAVVSNLTLTVRAPQFSSSPDTLNMIGQGFNLQLKGLTSHGPVIIFSSTNLMNWQPIFTNPATSDSLQFLDTNAPNLPFQFYRAVEQ